MDCVEELDGLLVEQAMSSRFSDAVTPSLRDASPIERVQHLLGRVYQVTWLLLPDQSEG
jgi:hypothetical protein